MHNLLLTISLGVRFKVMWLCLGATSKSPLTPNGQCSDMLAIADIDFFAKMAYTRVQRKILEIRLSEVSKKCRLNATLERGILNTLAQFQGCVSK